MTIEIIRYNLPPDQHVAFEQAYGDAQRYLATSPFCHGYELVHSIEEPNRYLLRIVWTSLDDHVNGFRKSPEFPKFFAAVKPYVAAIEEMQHYQPTAIVSPERP